MRAASPATSRRFSPGRSPAFSLTDPSPARRAAAAAMLCFAREAHAGRLEDGGLSDGDDGAADGGGSEDGGALMGPPALPKGGMATLMVGRRPSVLRTRQAGSVRQKSPAVAGAAAAGGARRHAQHFRALTDSVEAAIRAGARGSARPTQSAAARGGRAAAAAALPAAAPPRAPCPAAAAGDDGGGYSRKDKSLGLLCERFMEHFVGVGAGVLVCLDEAALQLAVERRRIYDVVNILETLNIVQRSSKNMYSWNGLRGVPAAVEALVEAARSRNEARRGSGGCGGGSDEEDEEDPLYGRTEGATGRAARSLGMLAGRFIAACAAGGVNATLCLDDAASGRDSTFNRKKHAEQIASGEIPEPLRGVDAPREVKTKVRRLYDIANVLVALGLLSKANGASRRPVFRWLGTESLRVFGEPAPARPSGGRRGGVGGAAVPARRARSLSGGSPVGGPYPSAEVCSPEEDGGDSPRHKRARVAAPASSLAPEAASATPLDAPAPDADMAAAGEAVAGGGGADASPLVPRAMQFEGACGEDSHAAPVDSIVAATVA